MTASKYELEIELSLPINTIIYQGDYIVDGDDGLDLYHKYSGDKAIRYQSLEYKVCKEKPCKLKVYNVDKAVKDDYAWFEKQMLKHEKDIVKIIKEDVNIGDLEEGELYKVRLTCDMTPYRIKSGRTYKITGTLKYEPHTGLKEFTFYADIGKTYFFSETQNIKIDLIEGAPKEEPELIILGATKEEEKGLPDKIDLCCVISPK